MKRFATLFSLICLMALVFVGSVDAAVTIDNNGARSRNRVRESRRVIQSRAQLNDSRMDTTVVTEDMTGSNEVKNNTGSDVDMNTVTSGTTSANLMVDNVANSNVDMSSFEAERNLNVTIQKNGNDSSNVVRVSRTRRNSVLQGNDSRINNRVRVSQNTGSNMVNGNTGGMTHSISSGNTSTSVTVINDANVNSLGENQVQD